MGMEEDYVFTVAEIPTVAAVMAREYLCNGESIRAGHGGGAEESIPHLHKALSAEGAEWLGASRD